MFGSRRFSPNYGGLDKCRHLPMQKKVYIGVVLYLTPAQVTGPTRGSGRTRSFFHGPSFFTFILYGIDYGQWLSSGGGGFFVCFSFEHRQKSCLQRQVIKFVEQRKWSPNSGEVGGINFSRAGRAAFIFVQPTPHLAVIGGIGRFRSIFSRSATSKFIF